ncbi:AraC family transcriptional regulator [Saccharospirillum mangrovi]|uniref:AraC family transcriptional regulator n=1 Tax=Saccharospirillum mangrovi TaxID=2161747 RepID=UPI000D375503|nr:AraC family transcriptional regulator [Saccharospirillum mangrovi]
MSPDTQPSVSAIAVVDLARELLRLNIIDETDLRQLHGPLATQVAVLNKGGDISDVLERRYPEAWLVWLWQQADQRPFYPSVGIEFGARILPESRGLPSHLLQTCRDLGDVLNTYLDNILLVNPADQWTVETEGERTVLSFKFLSAFDYPRCAVERSMAALYHWGCYLCEQTLPLLAVDFTFDQPDYHRVVERCFNAPIRYQAQRNALIVPSAVFATQVQGGDQPYIRKILSQRALELRSHIGDQQTVSGRVRQLLDQDLAHYGDQSNLADALYMSRSTLVRKLAREGVRFSQLLDEARRRCFQRLHNLPATQIADRLGFMDVSAFYKARRRWE